MNNIRHFFLVGLVAVIIFTACDNATTSSGSVNQTPTAADYNIGNLTKTAGSATAVTVTAKAGKSPGTVTVWYTGTGSTTYAKSTSVPTAAGTYAVTFDVAAASGWNAASGLSAGTLTINGQNQTPTAADYDIGNLTQTAGSVTAVTITPKTGKSTGTVTIYYEGTDTTTYAKSTSVPTSAGTYAVTFDVAAATGWNAVSGLSAGILTINTAIPGNQTPVSADYDIGNLTQTAGSVTAVTITPKSGKSAGTVTIYYEGTDTTTYAKNTSVPTAAGTYAVTFNVAAANGWNAASGLSAGILTINTAIPGNQTPVSADYDIGNLNQTAGSVTAVTTTRRTGDLAGTVTIYYEGTDTTTYAKSSTLPQTAGTYAVTFNVAAVSGWNAVSGLSAGTLTINEAIPGNQTPVAADYTIGNLNQTAGSVTAVTITPKTGKSPGTVTIYYEGTGGTTYAKNTSVPTAAGTYAVTFNVAAEIGRASCRERVWS
jgi:gas vesicle protein